MLSNFWKYGAMALIASALVMTPAFSQGNSQGHGKGKGHNKHDEGDDEGKHNKKTLADEGELQVERGGVTHAGFAELAALDAADAEEFFTALLQVGLNGADIFRRHDENHADTHVEGLQQLIGVDFAELGEILEDGGNGPGGEVNFRF